MSIVVELSGTELIAPVVHDLCAEGGSPAGALHRALYAHIYERFTTALAGLPIKPLRINPEPGPSSDGPATLPDLSKSRQEFWYITVDFITSPETVIDELKVVGDDLLDVRLVDYGFGVFRSARLKTVKRKRQTNYTLQLNHLRISGDLFRAVRNALFDVSKIQPLLPNFCPGPDIEGFHVVSYDNMLTGARSFCDCSRDVHQHMLSQANERVSGYVTGSWPHKFIELLGGPSPEYAEGICHLCLARNASPEEAARQYGPGIEKNFESFIDQVMFDTGLDRKTARAQIQQTLGLSRWVREAELFATVRDLFKDQQVLREASPEWLGRMRLDIYLPELRLAIEHQGEQHYRPISVFGGKEAHARVVERDTLKRQLCKENGVEVVDVRFDAPLTKASIRQRLQRYLTPG